MIKKLYITVMLLSAAAISINTNASAPETPRTPEVIRKALTDAITEQQKLNPEDPNYTKISKHIAALQETAHDLKKIIPNASYQLSGR